jgi:carbonic anhydrase
MGSLYDRLLAENERWVAAFDRSRLTAPPALGLAVIACMDARITVEDMLGLRSGDAHIIRNAGGSVTPDILRSLVVSQRKLGTREVMLVHHSNCGMQTLTEEGFKDEIEADTGLRPDWPIEAFTDVDTDVRESIRRVRECAFLPYRDEVRGFVFDVHTGELREVT